MAEIPANAMNRLNITLRIQKIWLKIVLLLYLLYLRTGTWFL